MTTKLSHLKPVQLDSPASCDGLFPHETLASAACVGAAGSAKNVAELNPDDTVSPVGFLLGWHQKPTVEILRIDPKDAKDALVRHALAKGLQQKILTFRRAGRESYGFALVYSAKITFRQSELIATLDNPEPTECVCVEVVWQDDRRLFIAAINRPGDAAPSLGGWNLLETPEKGSLWHEVGPVLAPMAFAEAIMLGFEAPEGDANG